MLNVSSSHADATCPRPETGNYWEDVANPRECALLTEFPGVLQRDGLTLSVKLRSARANPYVDDKDAHVLECGQGDSNVDDCIIYRAWEVSPNRQYVTLWVGYYEGGSVLLIDRATGSELALDSPPHLSPSGRYWAAVDHNYASGSGDIDIIGRRSGKPSIIASESGAFCDFERWDSDTSFLVSCAGIGEEERAEFRVTWNQIRELSKTPTGRDVPAAP